MPFMSCARSHSLSHLYCTPRSRARRRPRVLPRGAPRAPPARTSRAHLPRSPPALALPSPLSSFRSVVPLSCSKIAVIHKETTKKSLAVTRNALEKATRTWGALYNKWRRDVDTLGVRSEPIGTDRYRRRYRTFANDVTPRVWVEDPRSGEIGYYETRREIEQLRDWLAPNSYRELALLDGLTGLLADFDERLGKWERKVGVARNGKMWGASAAEVVPVLCRVAPRAAALVAAAFKKLGDAHAKAGGRSGAPPALTSQLTRMLSSKLRAVRFLLFTVTFYANHAHNLTRSP